MKKLIISLLILIILCTTCIPMIQYRTVNADTALTTDITFKYHRYEDDDYTGWNLWLWTDSNAGIKVSFGEFADGFVTATATVTFATKIGFIVRKSTVGNEWADKDISQDRFLDVSYIANGKLNVWLMEEETKIYYREEDVNTNPRIISAAITSSKTIRCKLSKSATNYNSFEVWELGASNIRLPISKVSMNSQRIYTIDMASDLSYGKQYLAKLSGFEDATVVVDSSVYGNASFENEYAYDGELGAIYTTESTTFKLWTPLASSVKLNLYDNGDNGVATKVVAMELGEKGVWSTTVDGDLHKTYYTYTVQQSLTAEANEVVDPYARSAGVNGKRGMVVDLSRTNPQGWSTQSIPNTNPRDAIIYEAHVRDLTIHASSGVPVEHRGKYLGLTYGDTVNQYNQSTSIDHIVELGANYLHLLPVYDFGSVDETKLSTPQFNWGYDPVNYNVPEGSYSTDPYNGEVRINEFKQMVQSIHTRGIKVVMDVVYNHTFLSADSDFNKIMYGYYYRMNGNSFYNGSGCGNVTASDRAMYRKFMIDSVVYWASEYKIDGFRFDLMGCHDIVTMNMISDALRQVNPDILIYGEGWTGGTTGLADNLSAIKGNASAMPTIGVFNDDMRDGIKGSVFSAQGTGFVSGAMGTADKVKLGVIGAVKGGKDALGVAGGYTASPMQSINYVSAHDNLTLWDKLSSSSNDSEQVRLAMNKLCAALVLTSQGTPFMTNGEEICRTKSNPDGTFNENSYNSPDSVNAIDWDRKNTYLDMFNYYKGLIAFRKANRDILADTAQEVFDSIEFLSTDDNVIAYTLTVGDNKYVFLFNGYGDGSSVDLPKGRWGVVSNGNVSGVEAFEIVSGSVGLDPLQSMILVSRHNYKGLTTTETILTISGGAVIVAAGIVTATLLLKKRRAQSSQK